MAEAHGFRLAFQFALDLRFRNIAYYSYIGFFIDDYRNIRSSFFNCLVEHVKRTSNVSTHHLFKFVLSFVDTIWIEDCPYCIVSYVIIDNIVA